MYYEEEFDDFDLNESIEEFDNEYYDYDYQPDTYTEYQDLPWGGDDMYEDWD